MCPCTTWHTGKFTKIASIYWIVHRAAFIQRIRLQTSVGLRHCIGTVWTYGRCIYQLNLIRCIC